MSATSKLGQRPARRSLLAAMVAAPATLVFARACAAAPAEADTVSLPDFRRPGDRDDGAALARAFASGRPVHAPAGKGSGPGGRYVVGNDGDSQLPSGATLTGDGIGRTVFVRSYTGPFAFILHCDSGSPDVRRNITGLRFRDLSFEDDVARGFEPYSYLVMLNGVTDVVFERVAFRGFRGDGLHLGSGTVSKVERHNVDVVVRDCIFDGINANNRNGISIIDGSDVVIERCRFRNTTRQGDGTLGNGDPHKPLTGLGQPGSIDIAPNADDFAIIRDIVVRGNHFTGGGGYAVSMLLLPNKDVRVPISGITIEGNVIENRYGGFDAFGFRGDGAMQSDRGYAITVRDNTVRGCEKPFIANGMRGLTITGNRFVDCTGHAELGYDSALANVTLSNNLFERVGGPQGNALWVRGGADVAITGNRFVDAGAAGRRDGISVAFVTGAMRRYAFSGNIFTSPTGRTAQPVLLFQDAKLDRGTLRLGDNRQPAATIPIPRLLGM